MTKVYPDHTLENAIRDRGVECRCLWELEGPKHGGIAWIVAYRINGRVVLVQTFRLGGWDAYTGAATNKISDTVADVFRRCGMDA